VSTSEVPYAESDAPDEAEIGSPSAEPEHEYEYVEPESLELSEAEVPCDPQDELSEEVLELSGAVPAISEPTETTAPDIVVDEGVEDSVDLDEEMATKLDLAAVYIDMGDAEGARDILDEVMLEGLDDHKRRASALLAKID
jgi:pilus assembly protein FimV